MSYKDFAPLREAHQAILSSREIQLIDDVDRCMHEIKVAACNYAEAVRALDKFRNEQAGARADSTPGNPF